MTQIYMSTIIWEFSFNVTLKYVMSKNSFLGRKKDVEKRLVINERRQLISACPQGELTPLLLKETIYWKKKRKEKEKNHPVV